MKKLFCCLLALLMILSASAALGENLLQMWEELSGYPSFLHDYEYNQDFDQLENSGERSIDGQLIGELADFSLDCSGYEIEDACETLIAAWAYDRGPESPLLNRLGQHFNDLDAQLLDSELYKWKMRNPYEGYDEFCIWEEYYLIEAAADFAEGRKEYHILACCETETEGGGSGASYYLLSENGHAPVEKDSDCFDVYADPMQVVNCSEWVSLRAAPDSQSERLARIPLGAYVEDVRYMENNSFIYCCYNGQYGYILRDYLR